MYTKIDFYELWFFYFDFHQFFYKILPTSSKEKVCQFRPLFAENIKLLNSIFDIALFIDTKVLVYII